MIAEDSGQVTFEFYTPYIIAATPPGDQPWAIYHSSCHNGLTLQGQAHCKISICTDQGKTWQDCGAFIDGMDLTDRVKGRRQYWLRFHCSAKALAKIGLTMVTVCQANPCTMPRLHDGESRVEFLASGRAVLSAGPSRPQAEAHIVAGRFNSPNVTLAVTTPRRDRSLSIFAAAHVLSGSPPSPEVMYRIEISRDGGKTWMPAVKDWNISRRGKEPNDFWSQSMCWGSENLDRDMTTAVHVRFSNTGKKPYVRCEAHLVYQAGSDPTRVTFKWTDDKGPHVAAHLFKGGVGGNAPSVWNLATGRNVHTRWVELEPVALRERDLK